VEESENYVQLVPRRITTWFPTDGEDSPKCTFEMLVNILNEQKADVEGQ
jgi:hypothetical protein